ncbi:MAG: DUF192 domain-containing protein [Elusimicrobiota bacterium]
MQLVNHTRKIIVSNNVHSAIDILSRVKGLIGKKSLSNDECMFFPNCNSIHTFFMSVDIGLILIDSKFRVVKIVALLKPYRIILPILSAKHVIEVSPEFTLKNVSHGDVLELKQCK